MISRSLKDGIESALLPIHLNSQQDTISLNVGGIIVLTSRHTLCSDTSSLLSSLFSSKQEYLNKDKIGNVLLDRDPQTIQQILVFLSSGTICDNPTSLLREEVRFWELSKLQRLLDTQYSASATRSRYYTCLGKTLRTISYSAKYS